MFWCVLEKWGDMNKKGAVQGMGKLLGVTGYWQQPGNSLVLLSLLVVMVTPFYRWGNKSASIVNGRSKIEFRASSKSLCHTAALTEGRTRVSIIFLFPRKMNKEISQDPGFGRESGKSALQSRIFWDVKNFPKAGRVRDSTREKRVYKELAGKASPELRKSWLITFYTW